MVLTAVLALIWAIAVAVKASDVSRGWLFAAAGLIAGIAVVAGLIRSSARLRKRRLVEWGLIAVVISIVPLVSVLPGIVQVGLMAAAEGFLLAFVALLVLRRNTSA